MPVMPSPKVRRTVSHTVNASDLAEIRQIRRLWRLPLCRRIVL